MRAEANRLIDAFGLTGKRIMKINVVGGHEAPTGAEGTAAQQNLEFVEAGNPNYAANGQLARDMFGVDDDTVTHVKITSMTLGMSSRAVCDGVSFYTPIPGVTAYNEITMAEVSEKEPYWILVTDLVVQPTKKQLNVAILGFNTNMNMNDLDNYSTQVRVRYKLLDQYGVESSEYEVSFRFSVAPSNEPPVEPSGTSSGQEHVDDNIPYNKPGTNEDERAPDPSDAERKLVTGTGNGIE